MDGTPSGLPNVGDLSWGTHWGQVFANRADLVETLVPYFRAGLERGERCLWLTAHPLDAPAARAALAEAVPGLDSYLTQGQIDIVEADASDPRGGVDVMAAAWERQMKVANAEGFAGLRLSGNLSCLGAQQSSRFADYENRMDQVLRRGRVVALCSYSLDDCTHHQLLDLIQSHQCTLLRCGHSWQPISGDGLRTADSDLRVLADNLEQRLIQRAGQLEAAIRARDEFLGVASHELRTPLGSLKLYVDGLVRALERGELDRTTILDRLRKAQRQSVRMDMMVGNLLDVTRARSGRLQMLLEDVDLSEVVHGMKELHGTWLPSESALTIDAPLRVSGRWDRLRLEQVIANLVSNAIRHAPGSPVHVSVRGEGDQAVLVVADQGPGISAADQPRIFERYLSVTPKPGGLGLGLWVVKQIVEAMGGSVGVDSREGSGAAFTVRLPYGRGVRAHA